MRPKVSVIIPVYNMEKYLSRCLETLIHQTLREIEIIIVDDGSKDLSVDILKEFANKDQRIIPIYNENGGAASARNTAISLAKGEYIAFVDSDDWIDLEMLKTSYEKAITDNADIVVFNFRKAKNINDIFPSSPINEETVKISQQVLGKFSYTYLFEMKGANVWNKLYRTEFVHNNELRFSEVRIGEDLFFNLKSLLFYPKISFINDDLYYYFINAKSVTKSYAKNQSEDFAKSLEDIIEISKKNNNLDHLSQCIPLLALRGVSTSLFNRYQYDNTFMFLFNYIKEILDIETYLYWLEQGKKMNSAKMITHKANKKHTEIFFNLVYYKHYVLLSMLEWIRFRFITSKKEMWRSDNDKQKK